MLKKMLALAVVWALALAMTGCATNGQNGSGRTYWEPGITGGSGGGHYGHH